MALATDRAQGSEGSGFDTRHMMALVVTVIGILAFLYSACAYFYAGTEGLGAGIQGMLEAFGHLAAFKFEFGPIFTILFIGGLAYRYVLWKRDEGSRPFSGSLLNDQSFRSIFFEVLVITLLCVFIWWVLGNTITNLVRLNIASGWGFLKAQSGFGIIQALVDYSEISSYGQALLVGFWNTILVAVVGVILATVIGFVIGVSRLSKNYVISTLATWYVETLRNIPLLLQIFFWYFAVLRAVPDRRDAISLFDTIHLNITGLYFPKLVFHDGSGVVLWGLLAAVIASFVIGSWAKKRQMKTGQQFPVFKASLGLIIGVPLVLYFVMGMPIALEHPVFVHEGPIFRRGFTTGVGGVLIPEFLALLFALALYTGAFIAEIVRAGILAVSHGQTEAAYSLGLRSGPTLRLVVIPQAMRVIIPPLTSQYLNLTKNSSLAVAIAYPDLVSIGGTTLNQTGQAIEIVSVWMVVYLSISLATSTFMNWYNKRMALVER